jgi:hypothetical protein
MGAEEIRRLIGCELKEMEELITSFEPWEIKPYPAKGSRRACRCVPGQPSPLSFTPNKVRMCGLVYSTQRPCTYFESPGTEARPSSGTTPAKATGSSSVSTRKKRRKPTWLKLLHARTRRLLQKTAGYCRQRIVGTVSLFLQACMRILQYHFLATVSMKMRRRWLSCAKVHASGSSLQ